MKKTTNKKTTIKRYIVRAKDAGVFYCGIASMKGKEAVLTDARRIHRWRGATECIGIALKGVGRQSSITASVPTMTVTEVIEFIPCTKEAIECLDKHPAWTV